LVWFLLKKNNKTNLKRKTNWKQFKPTGFGSVILEQKPVQIGLVWFFQFCLIFWFGSVFFDFGSVWFF